MTETLKISACLITTVFFFLATNRCVGILQQCGYKRSNYYKWLKRKDNLWFNRIWLWFLLSFLSVAMTSLAFSFLGTSSGWYISAVPYFVFSLLFVIADTKYALKVKTVKTRRTVGLSAIFVLCTACISYIFIALLVFLEKLIDNETYSVFAFAPYSVMILLLPVIWSLANGIESIFANIRNNKFVKKSKAVISENKSIKIAVVGSYGKTSVKNILSDIFSEKYTVVSTPKSYNTPVGIAKTVLSDEFENKDVFIAEMGARNVSDIKELADTVHPDYAIFTGVCNQHIETFGSEENVFKAKSEIFDGTKNVVLCGKTLEKYLTPENKNAVLSKSEIQNVNYGASSTTFTLKTEKNTYNIETTLLGDTAVENISLCVELAEIIGLSYEEIVKGIAKIEQIPHRLQLTVSNGVNVLDDSYNSNEKGAKTAVDCLKRLSGKKTVITPGIVETGIMQEDINYNLGTLLVGLDEVIVIGDTLAQIIKKGYLSAGGEKEKIKVVPTLEKASEYFKNLSEGDSILFLNDLPDAY